MGSISFPAGSRIGGFVVGELVFRDDACCVYLGKDAGEKEYTLIVPASPPGPELESDMAVWSSPKHHEFVSGIRVLRSPLPLIAVPYVAGLTLPEFLLTGRRFSGEDAVKMAQLAAEGASVLAKAGCRNRVIGTNNLVISAEGAVKLLPGFDSFSLSAAPEQALRGLIEEILRAAAEPKEPAAALLAKIEALPRDVRLSPLILTVLEPQKDGKPRRGKMKKSLRAGGLVLLAAAAAAALVLFFLPRQEKIRTAADNTVNLTSDHHTSGPQIYELAAPEESPPVSPPPEQIPAAPPAAARRSPAAVSLKRPKAAAKRRGASPARGAKRSGFSPAADAARRGNLLDLRTAISSKYDLELPDRYGKTALEYASAAAWKQMIDILVNAGAKITPQAVSAARDIRTRNYLLALKNPRPAKAPAKDPAQARAKPAPPPANAAPPDTTGWKAPQRKMWGFVLEPALRQARAQNKPVLVFFPGDARSDAMKDMARNVLFAQEFRRMAKTMELVWLSVSDKDHLPQPQLAYNRKLRDKLFKNCPLPSAVVLDPDGKVRGHIPGIRTKADFISSLKRLLRR